MLDGCKEWQRRELQDIPKAIQEATDAYREDQDVLGSWLSECTEESSVETAFADLYASYKAWCIDNGLMAASAKVLGRRLKERRYEPRKSNGKMLYSLALTDRRHLGFSAPSKRAVRRSKSTFRHSSATISPCRMAVCKANSMAGRRYGFRALLHPS